MIETTYAEMLGGPMDGAYEVEKDDDAGTMSASPVEFPSGSMVHVYLWESEPERPYRYDGVRFT